MWYPQRCVRIETRNEITSDRMKEKRAKAENFLVPKTASNKYKLLITLIHKRNQYESDRKSHGTFHPRAMLSLQWQSRKEEKNANRQIRRRQTPRAYCSLNSFEHGKWNKFPGDVKKYSAEIWSAKSPRLPSECLCVLACSRNDFFARLLNLCAERIKWNVFVFAVNSAWNQKCIHSSTTY